MASSTVAAWPPSTAGELTRTWQPAWPCAVGQVLGPQRRGRGDPTHQVDDAGRHWRATRTPLGPATLCVQPRPREGDVLGRAWGPGAEWVLDAMPGLLGASTTPPASSPTTTRPSPRAGVATGTGASGGTGRVMEALVPSILEQKVTGKQAFGSFRDLVVRHGEPAPGPVGVAAAARAAEPGHDRRDPVVGVAQARRRPGQVTDPGHGLPGGRFAGARRGCRPEEADRRLRSIRGIGVWTSAEVRQRALGDPDAVSFGDYHLANWVGWALFGHDITDEEMAEALEPYRPQRGRAAAMAMAGGRPAAEARAADEHPDAPADPLTALREPVQTT